MPAATASANTSKKRGTAKTAARMSAPTRSTGKTTRKASSKATATAKSTTTTKSTTAAKSSTTAKSSGNKRKAQDEETKNTEARPTKKSKSTVAAVDAPAATQKESEPKQPKRPKLRHAKVINEVPTQILKVFVFGEGSAGELGLGGTGSVRDVKRPRFNAKLDPETVGVVQLATGGMHCAALTKDGSILTWGVNDQCALGRDTKEGEVFVEAGQESDQKTKINGAANDSDDDSDLDALNDIEATPHPVSLQNVPEGTVFTSIAASDSCTFAITDDGKVFGCGTFRNNEGILGFSKTVEVQKFLTHIPELKKIKKVVCGTNHALAINESGTLFSWGAGQQNQLGRRLVERSKFYGLIPGEFGTPKGKFTDIGTGSYNSFAIDKKGQVWAWGLNSYGETGISDGVGEEEGEAFILPTIVPGFSDKGVVQISGGAHHTLAVCEDGSVLGVGRVDGFQLGDDGSSFPDEDKIRDIRGNVRILTTPHQIPHLPKKAVCASTGPDHSLVVLNTGRAYSWGFSVNYQTAQGTSDDVEEPTLVDNTATRDEELVWCGAGGQYGVFAAIYKASK